MRLATEFRGQGIDDSPDNIDEMVDAGLVLIAPALVQSGKRNIVGRMEISPVDKILDTPGFRFFVHD